MVVSGSYIPLCHIISSIIITTIMAYHKFASLLFFFFLCCLLHPITAKLHEGTIISVLSTTESLAWTKPMHAIIICGTFYQWLYFIQLFVSTPRFFLSTVFRQIDSFLYQCTLFSPVRFHSAPWTVIVNLCSWVHQNSNEVF